jgi:hypothetical protein
VHDVEDVEVDFALALVAASLYGLVSPLITRRTRLVVPPLFLAAAFLVTFAYVTARLLFFPHQPYELAKFSEWPEFCFASALAVFAGLSWRWTRRAQ